MKRCLYEILEVAIDCDAKTLKKAYYRLALEFHPDKSTAVNSTEVFQGIQDAYQVLSDMKERRWYDEHREQLLHEDDDDAEKTHAFVVDIAKYIGSRVFSGYGIDEDSFYVVYQRAFDEVT